MKSQSKFEIILNENGEVEVHKDSKPFFVQRHTDSAVSDENGKVTLRESGLNLSVSTEKNAGSMRLFIDGDGKCGQFTYPSAIRTNPDDILLIPHFDGVAFRADEKETLLPEVMSATASGLSMAFFGILREDCFLLAAIITNIDANVRLTRDDEGLMSPEVIWLPEKGCFGYRREIRYIAGNGGISELCAEYRKIADEKGLRLPFTERVKQNPMIDRLVGAANVWVWNDDAMDKLYSENAVYRIPTKEQLEKRVRVAEDMKNSGMERVMWSIFDENIDVPTVEQIKALGYITTFYDIYTDVIPHDIENLIPETRRVRCLPRRDCWPDGVAVDEHGNMAKAWQLKGTDGKFHSQNRICDAAALECLTKHAPEHSKENFLDGRFLDVQCVGVNECWSKAHPMTRRRAMEYKRKMFGVLRENKIFSGTEVGCEDAAAFFDYDEGMLSPTIYRQYDSGRRMTHIYEGEQIEPVINRFMLNPKVRVPLWELIYHGHVQSYWYWGDSANCMPELTKKRDNFCRLWGLPEIYSFKVGDWERLKEPIIGSYNRTAKLAKTVGYATMERFDYLDDDHLVQRTTFSNGISVAANFSEKPFVYLGKEIPAGDSAVFLNGEPTDM